jgi:hypothetical protein
MADEGQANPNWEPVERTGRFSVPHRGGTVMEVGEAICVGGLKPWLCIVKLLGRREPSAPNLEDHVEQPESEHLRTLLLRSGRGATADEARRDALSQLALVYGSPVGPAPEAKISHLEVTPAPPQAASGWLTRLFGRAR